MNLESLAFTSVLMFIGFGYVLALVRNEENEERFFIGMWVSLLLLTIFEGLFNFIASRIVSP